MTKKNINVEEIRTLVYKGLSDEKIAHTLGTNRKHIQEFRHLYNLPSGSEVISQKRNSKIEELLSKGMSGGEICRTLHISPATIAKVKKEKGIQGAFDMKMSKEDIDKAMVMAQEGKTDVTIQLGGA